MDIKALCMHRNEKKMCEFSGAKDIAYSAHRGHDMKIDTVTRFVSMLFAATEKMPL